MPNLDDEIEGEIEGKIEGEMEGMMEDETPCRQWRPLYRSTSLTSEGPYP